MRGLVRQDACRALCRCVSVSFSLTQEATQLLTTRVPDQVAAAIDGVKRKRNGQNRLGAQRRPCGHVAHRVEQLRHQACLLEAYERQGYVCECADVLWKRGLEGREGRGMRLTHQTGRQTGARDARNDGHVHVERVLCKRDGVFSNRSASLWMRCPCSPCKWSGAG